MFYANPGGIKERWLRRLIRTHCVPQLARYCPLAGAKKTRYCPGHCPLLPLEHASKRHFSGHALPVCVPATLTWRLAYYTPCSPPRTLLSVATLPQWRPLLCFVLARFLKAWIVMSCRFVVEIYTSKQTLCSRKNNLVCGLHTFLKYKTYSLLIYYNSIFSPFKDGNQHYWFTPHV